MATLTLQTPTDFSAYTGSFDWGWKLAVVGSTSITLSGGAYTATLTGSFTVTPTAVQGRGTTYTQTHNGAPEFTITGLNADAFTLQYYSVNTTNPYQFYAYLLIGSDTITGSAGNDVLQGYASNDVINGGAGVDTAVYGSSRSFYTVARTATGLTVSSGAGGTDGTDTLVGIERLKFTDTWVAYDTSGNGGQAYRLYQAAFNRAPDKGGLGFQMRALDNGATVRQVAQNFIDSPEFRATYGALGDSQFVNQLYRNVLHREGEASGVAYHTGTLASGMTRADVLVGFSESPENQAALIGTIQNGMVYSV